VAVVRQKAENPKRAVNRGVTARWVLLISLCDHHTRVYQHCFDCWTTYTELSESCQNSHR